MSRLIIKTNSNRTLKALWSEICSHLDDIEIPYTTEQGDVTTPIMDYEISLEESYELDPEFYLDIETEFQYKKRDKK
jgi:hypothetical protein